MTKEELEMVRKMIKNAYEQGFIAAWEHSGEGFNSDYGCNDNCFARMLNEETTTYVNLMNDCMPYIFEVDNG